MRDKIVDFLTGKPILPLERYSKYTIFIIPFLPENVKLCKNGGEGNGKGNFRGRGIPKN